MFVVEVYAAVRQFVFDDGKSRREAARVFGLLRTCQHYSRAEFDAAAADIEKVPENTRSPLLDAFAFFRGVNYLKSFILKSNGTTRYYRNREPPSCKRIPFPKPRAMNTSSRSHAVARRFLMVLRLSTSMTMIRRSSYSRKPPRVPILNCVHGR